MEDGDAPRPSRTASSTFTPPVMNWPALRAMFIMPASWATSSWSTSAPSSAVAFDVRLQGPGESCFFATALSTSARSALTQQPRPGSWRFRSGTTRAVRAGDEADQFIRRSRSRG